jgi:hypothetical protein
MSQISEIRRFTAAGNDRFIELITTRPNNLTDLVSDLAFSDEYTIKSHLSTPFEVPKTRRDLGESLIKYLGEGQALRAFSRDPLLWNWISAALMPHLLGSPADFGYIGETERWILSQASFRYYRHLCAGAFFAYEAHADNPDRAMAILCQDIRRPGDVVGQIQGTEDLAYSVGAEVATLLYFDATTRQIKAGAGGKGPGSARRLAANYLNQIRVTVDFKGMKAKEIYDLLPAEFDRFKLKAPMQVEDLGDEDYDFDSLRAQLDG